MSKAPFFLRIRKMEKNVKESEPVVKRIKGGVPHSKRIRLF